MSPTKCPKCNRDTLSVFTHQGKPALYSCSNCDYYFDVSADHAKTEATCPECQSSNVTTVDKAQTYTRYKCNTCGEESVYFSKPKIPKKSTKKNEVDHPSHYQNGMKVEVECIMFTRNMSFSLGNAFKYIWRAGNKASAAMDTDLAKAMWYLKDAAEHPECENAMYTAQTANLVHFLPKNELVDWKYQILSCILQCNIMTAIQLLTSGMTDPAS